MRYGGPPPAVALTFPSKHLFPRKGGPNGPNQTWYELSHSISENVWESTVETAENLSAWLAAGGAPANVTGIVEFDRIVNSAHINYAKNPTFLDYIKVYAPKDNGNNPHG